MEILQTVLHSLLKVISLFLTLMGVSYAITLGVILAIKNHVKLDRNFNVFMHDGENLKKTK